MKESILIENVKIIQKELTSFLQKHDYDAYVQWLGVLNINNDFSFLLQTETDKERDRLILSSDISKELEILIVKYRPKETDFRDSDFMIESQETVDRSYKGNWYFATK